jgi:hypothetical protein
MKKLWIAIAVVLVIAAVVAGVIMLGGGENGKTPVNPTTTPGKTIQQPGGGKATINFEGPPELEMSFEEFKVEMGEFRVVGTVKNASSDTTIVIELSGVGIFVEGEQVAALFNPEKELKPGDTWKIQKGFIYLVPEEEEVKMVVKVMDFRKVETQPTTTPTKTTEPAVTDPIKTPSEDGLYTFYMNDYPENPQGPAEVIAAFYGRLFEEKYTEALDLMVTDLREDPRAEDGIKGWYKSALEEWSGNMPVKVEFKLYYSKDWYAFSKTTTTTWYFEDGSTDSGATLSVEKTDEGWRITTK